VAGQTSGIVAVGDAEGFSDHDVAAYGGLLIMRGLKSFPVLFTAH
jgi:hypothetical protein